VAAAERMHQVAPRHHTSLSPSPTHTTLKHTTKHTVQMTSHAKQYSIQTLIQFGGLFHYHTCNFEFMLKFKNTNPAPFR